jgi:hypothetical protein
MTNPVEAFIEQLCVRLQVVYGGTIPDSGGEKWQAIDTALRKGNRTLTGPSSLARFLANHRGVRNRKNIEIALQNQEWASLWINEQRRHHWRNPPHGKASCSENGQGVPRKKLTISSPLAALLSREQASLGK